MANGTSIPSHLGDGLWLRSVSSARDVDRLCTFNAMVFEDPAVGAFARWWLNGKHPSLNLAHCLFIEDSGSGLVVSSLCVVPQTWTLDGERIRIGQIELVGTHPDYRCRGLMRHLMRAAHYLLASDGCLLSSIEGIPYFYRQFGYEYGVPLGSCAAISTDRIPSTSLGTEPGCELRPLSVSLDLPQVMALYDMHNARLNLHAERSEALWRFQESVPDDTPEPTSTYVAAQSGIIWAYMRVRKSMWGEDLEITEACLNLERSTLSADQAWLILLGLARTSAEKRHYRRVCFALPRSHPMLNVAYRLGAESQRQYAWQVRLMNAERMLRALAPVLAARLSRSAHDNHPAPVLIDCGGGWLSLAFEDGRVTVATEVAKEDRRSAQRIQLPWLAQLVLGYRSISELMDITLDVRASATALAILEDLFPKLDAYIYEPV